MRGLQLNKTQLQQWTNQSTFSLIVPENSTWCMHAVPENNAVITVVHTRVVTMLVVQCMLLYKKIIANRAMVRLATNM